MCGILGSWLLNDKPNISLAMNAMAHRGPDSEGTFFSKSGHLALGHKRLAIQDLTSAGHQPMLDSLTGNVLVYNGEIYNVDYLRSIMIDKGYTFSSNSDTEVLLKLYDVYGFNLLKHVKGIFAFSIYDKNKDIIFLARDAAGVKPLFYSINEYGFQFCSELGGLQALTPHKPNINNDEIEHYLHYVWSPGEETPIKGVHSLAPGEAMIVKDAMIHKKWSWYVHPIFTTNKSKMSASDAIIGTRLNLKAAVERQLISDAPIATFLSGGLDSSAITAFAAKKNPRLTSFTIDTDATSEGFTEDLPYARKVAKHLGTNLEVIKLEPDKLIGDLEFMVGILGEPIADPATLNVFYICQRAREMGFKVLLSGAGGDDVFTGYRRHQAAFADQFIKHLPTDLLNSIVNVIRRGKWKTVQTRRIEKLLSNSELRGNERLINYFRWIDKHTAENLFTDEFKQSLSPRKPNERMLFEIERIKNDANDIEKLLYLEQRFFLNNHNLIYTDRMSMAAGIEVRVPFLDEDLVNFASTIPTRFKQNKFTGKWCLKKAMEPYLPKKVIYRGKTGFGAPLRAWITGPLASFVDDFVASKSFQDRGIFKRSEVEKLIQNNKNGQIDAAYTILTIVCVEIWCRKYIDA